MKTQIWRPQQTAAIQLANLGGTRCIPLNVSTFLFAHSVNFLELRGANEDAGKKIIQGFTDSRIKVQRFRLFQLTSWMSRVIC